MLPRYDDEMHLTSVLRSEIMTLIDEYQIEGEKVAVRFFHPDRTQRARIDLQRAIFDQRSFMLRADEPVKIVSDQFSADGSGLVYSIKKSQGFLMGPVKTVIESPAPTAMNHSSIPKFGISALFGASLLPLFAAAPPPVSQEEKAGIRADAQPMTEQVMEANRQARTDLRADLAASNAANQAVESFLVQADLLDKAVDRSPSFPAKAAPLEIAPNPLKTHIDCDGGLYFDAEEGVLVFLKNVRVNDPRFTLSGANELKVFFLKKEDASKKNQDGKVSLNIGEVDRIVASGSVLIKETRKGGEPPKEASGAIFTYNVRSEIALLSGGRPWVKFGDNLTRAKKNEATLRVNMKTGEVSFDSPADTDLKLNDINR